MGDNALSVKMRKDHDPTAAQSDKGLSAFAEVLAAARKALVRADTWDIETCHYDRLRTDCEVLGVAGNDMAITVALRDAFKELTADKLHCRKDTSYSGLANDQTLYECRWQSRRFARMMYVKFAINGERIEIFTFHENTE